MKKLLSLCLLLVLALTGQAASVLKPNDRIIFIGDSITGQGRNVASGWANLIDQALKTARPSDNLTTVSLGGSGQSVGSWQNVEKKSQTDPVFLDVKTVDVKATLDGGAEVVVIMLGMNDALFPSLKDTPEAIENWATRYRALIASVRDRTHYRVLALATPTMCTEDPDSPKNKVIKALGAQVQAIAKTENAVVLPTYETMAQILNEGRTWKPDFHVTGDFVHPSYPGHVAIAVGMIKGLGEEADANDLLEKQTPKFWKKDEEALSYKVEVLPVPLDAKKTTYRIQSFHHAAGGALITDKANLTPPEGWRILSQKDNTFEVEGEPDRLVNKLTLSAGQKTVEIGIPAPWLIGTGNIGGKNWVQNREYHPELHPQAVDESLSKGEGFGQSAELEPGKPITWARYTPSVNFGGGNAPGAVDMAAVIFFQVFDRGYGARWIYSETGMPVTVQIKPLGFVSSSHLMVWLNGTQLHAAHLGDKAAQKSFEVTLNKGWNALVWESNSLQVQWQFGVDLAGKTEADTNSLRVAAWPPSK